MKLAIGASEAPAAGPDTITNRAPPTRASDLKNLDAERYVIYYSNASAWPSLGREYTTASEILMDQYPSRRIYHGPCIDSKNYVISTARDRYPLFRPAL